MPTLFDPLSAGAMRLKNRVLMAPLTRGRAGPGRVPNAMMAEYYAQRASAGLIVSEATAISREGFGWGGAPGAYTPEHMAGWRIVTDAVHEAGGLIALQLWHMGRLSHPDFIDGQTPLAPSPVAAPGETRSAGHAKSYVVPQAMTVDDIRRTVDDYAACARHAIAAGFDSVEIHGANGYLVDQFLRDSSNTRQDAYGGSIENRVRFLTETVAAVTDAIGSDRTGLRLSPVSNGTANGPETSDLEDVFVAATKALQPFSLAFLHIREVWHDEHGAPQPLRVTPKMRAIHKGALFANDMYDFKSGSAIVKDGGADAVVFGRPFIANPDLVERFRDGTPLNQPDMHTAYTPGPHGYVDYPRAADAA